MQDHDHVVILTHEEILPRDFGFWYQGAGFVAQCILRTTMRTGSPKFDRGWSELEQIYACLIPNPVRTARDGIANHNVSPSGVNPLQDGGFLTCPGWDYYKLSLLYQRLVFESDSQRFRACGGFTFWVGRTLPPFHRSQCRLARGRSYMIAEDQRPVDHERMKPKVRASCSRQTEFGCPSLKYPPVVFPKSPPAAMENELEYALSIFQEPEGYREPDLKPTFIKHQTIQGQELTLRLVGSSPLWVCSLDCPQLKTPK